MNYVNNYCNIIVIIVINVFVVSLCVLQQCIMLYVFVLIGYMFKCAYLDIDNTSLKLFVSFLLVHYIIPCIYFIPNLDFVLCSHDNPFWVNEDTIIIIID